LAFHSAAVHVALGRIFYINVQKANLEYSYVAVVVMEPP